MSKAQLTAAAAISLIGALATSQARAQSARADAEIAALKQQLRLMEQKLDKIQRQTAANTAAAATANAKVDAKVSVANANAAYPVKGPAAASDVVVKMPNNRPTICTADDQNCLPSPAGFTSTPADTTTTPILRRLFRNASTTASTSAARASA
jgi:phosphate-selective porin OprO and OprP